MDQGIFPSPDKWMFSACAESTVFLHKHFLNHGELLFISAKLTAYTEGSRSSQYIKGFSVSSWPKHARFGTMGGNSKFNFNC